MGPRHVSPASKGLKVNEGLFENLDLISHPSGPDRCEIQVQIPESLGPETPPWGISFRSALLGDDASIQPGQLQELMLHETAVSWMRERLKQTVPKKAWEETVDAYRSRLKACAAHINAKHDVKALCKEFPGRLAELSNRGGDRLGK